LSSVIKAQGSSSVIKAQGSSSLRLTGLPLASSKHGALSGSWPSRCRHPDIVLLRPRTGSGRPSTLWTLASDPFGGRRPPRIPFGSGTLVNRVDSCEEGDRGWSAVVWCDVSVHPSQRTQAQSLPTPSGTPDTSHEERRAQAGTQPKKKTIEGTEHGSNSSNSRCNGHTLLLASYFYRRAFLLAFALRSYDNRRGRGRHKMISVQDGHWSISTGNDHHIVAATATVQGQSPAPVAALRRRGGLDC
ncbi:hypothetical protein CMUS01_05047, partial [Colletotrichum musicola]